MVQNLEIEIETSEIGEKGTKCLEKPKGNTIKPYEKEKITNPIQD